MLSRRSHFDLTPNRLGEQLAKKIASGDRILDLTRSNPTRCGFVRPGVEAIATLAHPDASDYDPNPRGRLAARAAIARYYHDRGAAIDADRIVLSASTSEAYGWLFKLLCDDGDDVLAPCPSYPLFDFLARLEGVELRRYHLRYDGRWLLDVAEIEAAIRPRTRAILLVSPNNPTGSTVSPSELEALDAIAARRGLALISDEVFADFPHDDARSAPVAAAGVREALTFTLSGLSKVCGLPQMKLGWVAMGGDSRRLAETSPRLEIIADTYLSVATPIQLAAGSLLASRFGFIGEATTRIARNRARIAAAIARAPSVELLASDGGWSACLRVPRTRSEEELVLALLEDHGIVVHPGYFFDFADEAYLVLSLIVPEPEIEEGIERILLEVAR